MGSLYAFEEGAAHVAAEVSNLIQVCSTRLQVTQSDVKLHKNSYRNGFIKGRRPSHG